MKGWVYIITTKSMPNLVKVGFSKNTESRAAALNNTGNPHPYEVAYAVLVHDPRKVEKTAHMFLKAKGFHEKTVMAARNVGKEWFNCSIDIAVDAIKKASACVENLSSIPAGKFIIQDDIATHIETDLMWLRFAHGQQWKNGTVEGYIEDVNWHETIEISEEFNKKGGCGGFTDWRVPNKLELKTLIDKVNGEPGNYIDADVFPENRWGFWSSSSGTKDRSSAWSVDFYDGTSNFYGKSSSSNVRLVRG